MTTIEAAARADAEARKRRITPGRIGAWAVMIVLLIVTIFPFLWMIRTAFSTTRSLPSEPNSLLPVDFTWGAFERVLGLGTAEQAIAEGGSGASVNFWLYLRNSFIYAGAVTLGQVFFCSMAAYAFARLRWPGRRLGGRGQRRVRRARIVGLGHPLCPSDVGSSVRPRARRRHLGQFLKFDSLCGIGFRRPVAAAPLPARHPAAPPSLAAEAAPVSPARNRPFAFSATPPMLSNSARPVFQLATGDR